MVIDTILRVRYNPHGMRFRSLVTAVFFAAFLALGLAFGQGPGGYNPGAAQGLDLAGNWAPVFHEDATERGPGPELVNYLGIPITEGARLGGLSYDASRFTVPEHQCEVHGVSYIYRGPLNLRIWELRDPVSQQLVAIMNYIDNYEQTRTIWMDGRPHPSEHAPHTWMGFSTGKWEGNILTVYDHTSEAELDSSQRAASKRCGYAD